jgi:hypothetical protein
MATKTGLIEATIRIRELEVKLEDAERRIRVFLDSMDRGNNDVKRMDWLVAHYVEVRKPLVYGSHKMFVAQDLTSPEDDYHLTDLRNQVDAEIAKELKQSGLKP